LTAVVHFYKQVQIEVAKLWTVPSHLCCRGSRGIGGGGPPSGSGGGLPGGTDVPVQGHWPPDNLPRIPCAADAGRTSLLRYNRHLVDAVNARRMLERGRTDEISIRAGAVCMVEGIVQRIGEKILFG
jgi:hypothetical protein